MADTQSGREPANAGGSQGSEGKGKAAKAQLATSTLAIALSFLEVPLPLVGVLVGLAALPTLKKAQKAARQRRIEMSQLDLLTATTLAAMGDMRSAAEVLWITGLADVMHDSGIKGLRRKMAEIAPTPGLPAAEQRKLAAMLQQAPIGTTRTERTIRALADRLAAPLVGVAALVFALTRSPLRAANVLKFADIDSGIRITTPEAVLNALAVAAREGIFIRGGRPLEALAAVDAVVIDSPLSGPTAEQLGDAAGALLARGVARLVVRSGAHTEPIRRAAESLGAADAVEETDDPASAVQSLRRAGFRPALLWDGGPAPGGARDAAVCISLGGEGRVEDEAAEVVLLDGGVARLGDAIDLARRTTHVLRQNVGLVLGPTAAGLIAAVAGMTSPIATTLITNGSAALAGVNSLRPLGHTSQQEAPSKAPAALDRAAQPAG